MAFPTIRYAQREQLGGVAALFVVAVLLLLQLQLLPVLLVVVLLRLLQLQVLLPLRLVLLRCLSFPLLHLSFDNPKAKTIPLLLLLLLLLSSTLAAAVCR